MTASADRRQPTPRSGDGPRILVSRPDHLGDLLLTLPAIRALRRRLPGARITCMIPAGLIPIAQRAVDVHEVVVMPFALADPVPQPGSPVVEFTADALRGRFDLALLPRPSDPWSGVLAAAASVPIRVGHNQPAVLPYLTHAFPERDSRHVTSEAVILALRAAALLRPDRRRWRGDRAPWLRLLPDDRRAASDARRDSCADDAIVVHPAAGWALKTWPVERWGDLVSGLGERLRSPVLIVGEASDKPLLDEIAGRARGNAHVVHELPLGALAAVHATARVVVGMESGALHLAALMGAPVVGLFGPFGSHRVAPLAPAGRFRALSRRLPCSPCGTLEMPPCGATHEPACLVAITPDEVIDAAAGIASRSPGASAQIA